MLKTLPSAFANYVGGRLLPVKDKGIKNWLDDIAIPSKTLEDQWGLILFFFFFDPPADGEK